MCIKNRIHHIFTDRKKNIAVKYNQKFYTFITNTFNGRCSRILPKQTFLIHVAISPLALHGQTGQPEPRYVLLTLTKSNLKSGETVPHADRRTQPRQGFGWLPGDVTELGCFLSPWRNQWEDVKVMHTHMDINSLILRLFVYLSVYLTFSIMYMCVCVSISVANHLQCLVTIDICGC